MMESLDVVGVKLSEFMRELRSSPDLADAVVIVTADHGGLFERGKIWYGFHPDEEVVRVPLIVFDGQSIGVEDRMFGTIDLVHGVLDYFDINARFHPRAVSIFDGTQDTVAVMTLRSDLHREWFLLLYQNSEKYQFNLHPNGDGAVAVMRVDGYKELPMSDAPKRLRAIRKAFDVALSEYGIENKSIHQALR
jgi:arylsulfatase A-like enzyme